MNRFKFLAATFAFALLLVALPNAASAQYRDNDNDDYYRTERRNRNNDRNNNRNNNYNRRFLVDAVRRVEDTSRSFRRSLDRDLDNTRYNETRREDRINDVAERFATAIDNLEDAFDNGNNINSSQDEARTVFQLAQQIDRLMQRNQFSSNTESQWNTIRRDLNTVADAYNVNFNGNNNNRRNNDDWNNRNNRNNRNNNRRNNSRFPF